MKPSWLSSLDSFGLSKAASSSAWVVSNLVEQDFPFLKQPEVSTDGLVFYLNYTDGRRLLSLEVSPLGNIEVYAQDDNRARWASQSWWPSMACFSVEIEWVFSAL